VVGWARSGERLWSGGAGSPIRLTAAPQCSSDGRPAPPSRAAVALPASRRPRRAGDSGIGRRRWRTSRRPAWFCLMPRPRCRWPQMLGHRPSAFVVRGQALAGRLHRSLLLAGRAPPTGGDRCPRVGLSRRVAKYAPHRDRERCPPPHASDARRARREPKAEAAQSRDGSGDRRREPHRAPGERRICHLGGELFAAHARARTSDRAPRRLRLRFPSMPSPRSATNARGVCALSVVWQPLERTPPTNARERTTRPPRLPRLRSPSMPSARTHDKRSPQAAATATRRALGRPWSLVVDRAPRGSEVAGVSLRIGGPLAQRRPARGGWPTYPPMRWVSQPTRSRPPGCVPAHARFVTQLRRRCGARRARRARAARSANLSPGR
jgi:hypothetical protein